MSYQNVDLTICRSTLSTITKLIDEYLFLKREEIKLKRTAEKTKIFMKNFFAVPHMQDARDKFEEIWSHFENQ